MSELATAVVLGRAHRNSGILRSAHVVGHLYVGGSGLWQFNNIHRDEPQLAQPVRIRSTADFVDEIPAGFALAADLDGARQLATERLGADWADRDLELTRKVLREFGRPARDLPVACLITDLGGGASEAVDALSSLGWSVIVANKTQEALRSQRDG